MDRETLAQAVAMLVVLAALARWLPAGDADDPLGRGDPWRALELDRALLAEPPGSDQGAARLRAMFQREQIPRWRRLLAHVRTLHAQAGPHDVVQVRGLVRNEIWPLTCDLYPLRVIGASLEEGGAADAPIDPQAAWVLTARASGDPITLEAGPLRGAGESPR